MKPFLINKHMKDKTTTKPRKGGIDYWPTDWTAQCEAKCRKTGKQCPHTCNSQIPSTIASRQIMDANYFCVKGKPVNLCQSHWLSWHKRAKRLLTLPLINGGHLCPGNRHAYGSIIIKEDRLNFDDEKPKATIPPAWGWISWRGNVPEGLLERVPQFTNVQSVPPADEKPPTKPQDV